MLNTISIPSGIDIPIRKLQEHLFDALTVIWGLPDSKYQSYGRCYRNKKENGYVAEVYEGTGDYREVYYDDSVSAISFFGISDKIIQGVGQKTNVHLVFFANLSELKPNATNRADEEVRNDVINIIGNSKYGFTLESVDLWLENVLREYAGSYREERLKAVDMHPIHCFRLNFTLFYNINKNYCP